MLLCKICSVNPSPSYTYMQKSAVINLPSSCILSILRFMRSVPPTNSVCGRSALGWLARGCAGGRECTDDCLARVWARGVYRGECGIAVVALPAFGSGRMRRRMRRRSRTLDEGWSEFNGWKSGGTLSGINANYEKQSLWASQFQAGVIRTHHRDFMSSCVCKGCQPVCVNLVHITRRTKILVRNALD